MDNNLEMSLCETTGEFKTTMSIPIRISDEKEETAMSIPIRISDIKEKNKKVTSNSTKRQNNKKKKRRKKK